MKKKYYIFFISFLLLTLIEFFLFYFIKGDILALFVYPASKISPLLDKRIPLVQTFEVNCDISRIDIMLGNFAKKEGDFNDNLRGNLVFVLKSGDRTILKQSIKANLIKNNRFTSFSIPVGKNDLGKKTLKIILRYEKKKPEEKLIVWVTKRNKYKNGALFWGNKRLKSDMVFRYYCVKSYYEAFFTVLKKRIENINGLYNFIIFILLVFLLMGNYIFIRLTKLDIVIDYLLGMFSRRKE